MIFLALFVLGKSLFSIPENVVVLESRKYILKLFHTLRKALPKHIYCTDYTLHSTQDYYTLHNTPATPYTYEHNLLIHNIEY